MLTATVNYAVKGRAIGEEIVLGRYGSVVNGEISRENHLTYLRAIGATLVEVGAPPPDNLISWYSPMLGSSEGYGSSAEQMIRRLATSGYDVRIQPSFSMSGPHSNIAEQLEASASRFRNGPVRIAYTPPHPQQWKRAEPWQAMLGFSMWEDDGLPHAFDDAFREVDALAAPSTFCQKLFQDRLLELGLDIPVHLVPLGVDVAACPVRRRTYEHGRDVFTVIHSSTRASEARKGADVAIAAFRKAFPNQDDVRLVLRSRMNSFPDLKELLIDHRIVQRSGVIDDAERARLFHNAHVLLYPSRGEGFGLIPLEAMATGLPAIVSAGSGMLDYRDLYHPIATSPVPSEISVAWSAESTGSWHEPDVDAAAAQLRWVYEHYELAAEQALNSAWLIRENWTYDRTVTALAAAIEDARERHAA